MFCTKCGKQIEYNSTVCNECLASENATLTAENESLAAENASLAAQVENISRENASLFQPIPEEPVTEPQPSFYCTNCGKHINYAAKYCNECVAENAALTASPSVEAAPEYTYPHTSNEYYESRVNGGNPRMYGFGAALTSTILSVFGFAFSIVAMILAAFSAAGIFFFIVALGLSIPSLIMGIKSIGRFKSRRAEGYPAPIATLILGINGLPYSALGLFYSFFAFIVILAAI